METAVPVGALFTDTVYDDTTIQAEVDLNTAKELGMGVFNTPSGPTLAVAELTIGLILTLLRKTQVMNAQMKQGVWQKQMGNLLYGKKAGIVGFGRIGQKVAELLLPFGVAVSYSDVCVYSGSMKVELMSLDDLLKWNDIILLHASSQRGGQYLIGKPEIALMKEGVFIVNTSRGGLIDEDALAEAIKNKHISGAALDVFSEEPYTGALKAMDEVILTPHIGSYAKEARVSMENEAVRNLLKGFNI